LGHDPGCVSLLVMGIGNVLKGDDGVGPYVVGLLVKHADEEHAGTPSQRISAIDCGTVPENYTGVVRRLHPDHLVLVDAADMGLEAGAVRTIAADMIGALGLSTHSMPLSMFMSYVEKLVGRTTLVGVQPKTMNLGADMCQQVRTAGEEVAKLLREGNLGDISPLGKDITCR